MSKEKSKLSLWIYFRQGHSSYWAFFINFANFIVLQWALLLQNIDFIEAIFGSILVFSITFMIIYVPISIITGWFDFKRGAVPVQKRLGSLSDPWRMDITLVLKLIVEGKNKEAVKCLEKWIKEET